MSEPSINDAKALAYAHRKPAVIIISFGYGRFSGSSYGMTREKCRAAGAVLDEICNRIKSGEIEIPPELR